MNNTVTQQKLIQEISLDTYRLAVLVPCYNEALTISQVVKTFQSTLPAADVYVYDNRSTDNTAIQAKAAGANVRYEAQPGKGNVVRRMFADIDADIYIMVDGDNTYEASASERLVKRLIDEHLDMVVGARQPAIEDDSAYRPGHRGGNLFLTGVVQCLFGRRLKDMLSGYRVMSRRFVKSFPALSNGFETETELTIHALELNIPFVEEPTLFFSRPDGSESKLKTFSDGWRILGTALLLFKEIRPFLFFGIHFIFLSIIAFGLGLPLIKTYWETGLVPRFPTAILAASIMLLAFLSLTCGLVLDSVARGRREIKRMRYLSYSSTAIK
ncbi:glycosyl transferase [Leptolyngbya sp. PCC 7375]|nr:glycosyl transferase [Leptolyngbya sp. PCC 7375]